MVKRIKKPPIKPEQRRDWLRRHEEDGESPPQIAAKDGFDIRTVRKQIELAKQERESREARTLVLRNALEKHYDDLRKFAERLNSEIWEMPRVESSPDDDLMEAALRQHLPRSPMWGYLSKRQNLRQTAEEQKVKLNKAIEDAVKADRRLTTLTESGLQEVVVGVVAVLVFEAEQWLNGNTRHSLKDSLVCEPAGEGLVNPRFAFSHMGIMEERLAKTHMPTVRNALADLESRVKDLDDYHNAEKTVAETARLHGKLREELAIIRLRRIVPGRCKYCPI